MSTIGLILARGSSKDIPSKNMKLLGGKPLLAWTLEATLQSGVCDEVWVATDSKQIQQLAWQYNVTTLDLPSRMTADHVYSAEVAHYVMSGLTSISRTNVPSTLVFLQATSPFRTAKYITEAYALYRGLGTVIGVSQKKKYYWHSDLSESMSPVHASHAPRNRKVRQLTDSWDWFYEENGSVYIVNVKRFLAEKVYHLPPYIPYVMAEEESLQIDTPYDFWLAEKWLEYKNENAD